MTKRNSDASGCLGENGLGYVPGRVRGTGSFDGFHARTASVTKTCLVRFDNSRYSVYSSAVGRPVEFRAYAARIEIRQDGRPIGVHVRPFGRERTVYDPWHYIGLLGRKSGVLRNGAPFQDRVLPVSIERIRRRLVAVLLNGKPDCLFRRSLRQPSPAGSVHILCRGDYRPPRSDGTRGCGQVRSCPSAGCRLTKHRPGPGVSPAPCAMHGHVWTSTAGHGELHAA